MMQLYQILFSTMLPILATALPLQTMTSDTVAIKKANIMKELDAVQYLVRFGHLNGDKMSEIRKNRRSHSSPPTRRISSEIGENSLHPFTKEEIKNALKSLQNSLSLEISGELNEETLKAIKSPRCGVPDITKHSRNSLGMTIISRMKRYSISNRRWTKKYVTWKIARYRHNIAVQTQIKTFEKAFHQWEAVSPLIFKRSTRNYVDIVIQFVPTYHGDGFNFDGQGGVLAHTFLPGYKSINGDIHIDNAEKWNVDYDLFVVALHEIGHSIGLYHSKYYNSVMYAQYNKANKLLKLDDRMGVEALYGRCATVVDSALYIWAELYLFRKDMVWKVDEFSMDNYVSKGYPKKIKEEFNGLVPDNLDSTVKWSDYYLYFLKGSRSWGYSRWDKKIGYYDTVSNHWPGIPNNPDASVCLMIYRGEWGISWFFKDDLCYKMLDEYLTVEPGYPKKISEVWRGLPNNIDGGYYSLVMNQTYFFKGTEYWVMDNSKYAKEPFVVIPGGQSNWHWRGVCSEKY